MSVINKIILSALLTFVIFACGTTLEASANEGGNEVELPEGVERYYPKNPENLIDEEYFNLRSPYENDTYAINPSSPKSVTLTKDLKTASTSRILVSKNAGQKLAVSAQFKSFGARGTGVYTVFKSGVYYESYVAYNTNRAFFNLDVPGDEYSLRLYCGNPDELETGCSAEGGVSINY